MDFRIQAKRNNYVRLAQPKYVADKPRVHITPSPK